MLYKFKSGATADLVMLEPAGHRLLEVLGREPSDKGIFESADLPDLMRQLERAIEQEEAKPNARRKAKARPLFAPRSVCASACGRCAK